MMKRLVSFILAMVLVLGLIPMTAQAATGSVKGVTAIGSGYTRNRTTGIYAPNFTTMQAVTTDGKTIDNKVTSSAFYTTYSSGLVLNELKTAPVEGKTYYSKLTIECTDFDADAEAAYTKITIPGFVVEKVRGYFTDMGSKFVIIYSATMRSVYVGGVRVGNGTYLPAGATKTQLEKPDSGGYAYLDGDALTLDSFTYTGSGDSYKAGIYAEFPLTIKLNGQNTFDMDSGSTGIECTQDLIVCNGTLRTGSLTIYGDYGIVSDKNLTLQSGRYVIDTAKYECLYAGGDLTINTEPYLDLNCNDTTHGLAAINAEGNITVANSDDLYTLVSESPGGRLFAFNPAWDLSWYKRIIRDQFSNSVYVGGVLVSDGQYLAQGSTTPTTTKPADNYVHLKNGILTLHNFTLTNNGYQLKKGDTFKSQIISATGRSLILSLSGKNKLVIDESGELETLAFYVDGMMHIQQAANGATLDIECNKKAIYSWGTAMILDSGTVNIKSVNSALDMQYGYIHINGGALNIESNGLGIVARRGCSVGGGSVTVRAKLNGFYGYEQTSYFRVTDGNVVVISDESALDCRGTIDITGGSLYLKANGANNYDNEYTALNADETCTIASGLAVKASTEHDGELGAYDPAKYKEYDFVVIGDPDISMLDTCTVTFSPNGGTGTPFTKSDVIRDYYLTLPECPFQGTKSRTFTGWNIPGYTKLSAPGTSVRITEDTEILAGWTDLVIPEANATVDVPKIGNHPDMTPTVPDGVNYTAEVYYWYYSDGSGNYPHMTETDVIEPGMLLSLRLVFKPKAGYAFDANTVFTINGEETIPYGIPGNQEIKFYVGGYTITFDPCGGTTDTAAVQAYPSGKLPNLPNAEWTDDSKVFEGWYTAKTGGNKIDEDTVFTKDTTVYAQWKVNCYTITLDPNGGSVTPTSKQTDTSGWLTGLPAPTHSDPNKLFDGWHTSKTSYSPVADKCKFSKDTTLYAHWKDKPAHTIAEVYIESIQTPTAGVMPSNHVSITTTGVHGITDSGDTFWVRYDAASNDLTDIYEDGTFVDSVPFRDGETYLLMLVMEAQPTYGFTSDVKVFYKGAELPAPSVSDITASALLDHDDEYIVVIINPGKDAPAPTYTVIFDSDGGSAVAAQTVESGKAAAKPSDPTRDGYKFLGWYQGESKYDFSKPVTGNITLKAKWEKAVSAVTGVTRVFGSDRYQTAFKAADTLKIQLGIEKFQNVIAASGTGFADALAGSYLAAAKNAPILLVRGANVNDVKNYIKKNLASGGTVYLLGGVNAVPKTMETGLDGFTVKRLGGATRYDTNLLILKEAGVGNKDIIVCTGLNFADSLSASATGLPILLVKDGLTAAQKDFLNGTSGRKIIVGGTAAVNATVEKQLKTYGEVKRLAGNTRYDTSVLVAKEFFSAPKSAVLAYAQNFPDGLSGGPLAYALKAPLILTDNNKPTAAVNYGTSLGIKSGYVLGGTGLISDKVVRNVFSMAAADTIIVK